MKFKKGLVSILLCSYNAEKFIIPTINSLINQNYKQLEILVLDNNSKDKTVQLLKLKSKNFNNLKVFISEKNLGPYGGLNFLLEKAKGEFISIADHDDIYHPEKIKRQINFLNKNRKYIGCGTSLFKYFENKKQIKFISFKGPNFFSPHPSLVFRNNYNFRYNLEIKYKTDTFFMRYILCKNEKRIFNLRRPLYLSRVREDGNNLSKIWNKKISIKDILNYFKFSKNKKILVKFLFKKIFRYNFWINLSDLYNRKTINFFKKDPFLEKYLKYLKY